MQPMEPVQGRTRTTASLTSAERASLLRLLERIDASAESISHTLLVVGARAGHDGLGGWTRDQLDALVTAAGKLRGATMRASVEDG